MQQDNTILITLSRTTALERRMNVIANNIANINTPAFKANGTLFSEFLEGRSGSGASFVQDIGSYTNFVDGPLLSTDNPLDLAIKGEGFFTVESPDGPRYTRHGVFHLNQAGQIVNSEGYPLLSNAGAPIAIPAGATEIDINENGVVSTAEGDVGTIGLVRFENPQVLQKESGSLFSSTETGEPATGATVHQGMIEGSNVQAVIEMANMIQVSRSYQSAQRMIETEHDRIRTAMRKIMGSQ